MKMKLRKFMQQAASYIEIVLSAFLLIAIIFLAGKFIVESVLGIGCDNATLEYFLANVMTFAIGVEFVKMLCTHTPGTVIEVLLFAISRQMIVGHVSGFEVLAGWLQLQAFLQHISICIARVWGIQMKKKQ